MATIRRGKNYANDAQTPMFLYTILKQLDLRSIDWNVVAEAQDISNGHAARMRYSRMKQQFEGNQSQARAPKPKKDNTKDKGKGKRILLEEEEERVAVERNAAERRDTPNPAEKKVKQEHRPDMETAWKRARMTSRAPYLYPTWSHPEAESSNIQYNTDSYAAGLGNPVIKPEPVFGSSISSLAPLSETRIQAEPDTDAFIKKEPSFVTTTDNNILGEGIKLEAESQAPRANNPGAFSSRRDSGTEMIPKTEADTLPFVHSAQVAPFDDTGYATSIWPTNADFQASRMTNSAMSTVNFQNGHSFGNFMAPSHKTYNYGPTLNPLATSYGELLDLPLSCPEPRGGWMRHQVPPVRHVEAMRPMANMQSQDLTHNNQRMLMPLSMPVSTPWIPRMIEEVSDVDAECELEFSTGATGQIEGRDDSAMDPATSVNSNPEKVVDSSTLIKPEYVEID